MRPSLVARVSETLDGRHVTSVVLGRSRSVIN